MDTTDIKVKKPTIILFLIFIPVQFHSLLKKVYRITINPVIPIHILTAPLDNTVELMQTLLVVIVLPCL